ncbi:MAG: Na/Pi cotransporter family protein [Eubacterium sp.]|uniref:Na/Pi cotransporter family protein n=1 Tax=Eubacterium sp. TaxID=142586 RepID=UPI003A11BBD0
MDVYSVLSMIGGLALFLYGMHYMGEQLEKLSGGKLERILEKMTDKTIKGVLLGCAVTAVVQSSSAVTVMVVGFVNSGIMELSRAIGVIMGANIGTTVTAWILSLTGLSGDSLIINLLKPSSFAPVLAVIGVFLVMFTKKEKIKNIGGILTGFSVLMMGMTFMSDAMGGLADNEQFTSLLIKFSNPLLGILAGTVLTAVIQSSSASVGILQALAITGSVPFSTAFPIILGQNIGTCVTALISSVGTNKNAKRAAFAHLYFNIIGVVLALILFYGANAIFDFAFMSDAITASQIAVLHSVFNIFSTIVLLPFTKQLEFLACKTIKDSGKKAETPSVLLDDRFLINPSYAVEKSREITCKMADMVEKTAITSFSILKNFSDEKAQLILENEKETDKYEELLETYLVKISALNLSDEDSKNVFILHHAIENFEKIGDYSEDILKIKKNINKKNIIFSERAKYDLSVMMAATTKIITLAVEAFKTNDIVKAREIEPLEEVIDKLKKELKNRHLKRIEQGSCSVDQGFVYLDIINALERISDHCASLAVSMIELESGDYNVHEYTRELKETDKEFVENLDSYLEKYALN